MAKVYVLEPEEGTRTPFLRGILTQSLQRAGLPFEPAYRIASRVRDVIARRKDATVTTRELRQIVVEHLRDVDQGVARTYRRGPGAPLRPMVRERDGSLVPFSELSYRRCLEAAGVGTEQASAMAREILEHLSQRRRRVVRVQALGRLTHAWLRRTLGPGFARRFLVWADYNRRGTPVLILVGGTAGCGKSTLATDLATRLDIVRTQSTDMLREVMRMLIPERLLPVLHRSSFRAWEALPAPVRADLDEDALLETGFHGQAELLAVPSEAVTRRALAERVSLILEGVHVEPALQARLRDASEALVVPLMLAVLKPKQLRGRISGRGRDAPQRRAERYLQNFDAIWRLQGHLLDEAERFGIPIVVNDQRDRAVQEAMGLVVDALAQGFEGTPRSVFSEKG